MSFKLTSLLRHLDAVAGLIVCECLYQKSVIRVCDWNCSSILTMDDRLKR